jgi:6-phosphofructokinase 1
MPALSSYSRSEALAFLALASTVGITTSLLLSHLKAASSARRQQAAAKSAYQASKASAAAAKAAKASDSSNGVPMGKRLDDVSITDIYLWEVAHLGAIFQSACKGNVNRMKNAAASEPNTVATTSSGYSDDEYIHNEAEYNKLIASHECILGDIKLSPTTDTRRHAYVRAGPRKHLHFDPAQVTAAIVTCGGLCPGLNNVIRELTNSLTQLYGVKKVLGVRGGYAGFYNPQWEPVVLTPKLVETLHHDGGSFLGSSRGGFDLDATIAFLVKHGVNQLFVIGGDGTHRGAFRIHEECMERGMNVAVCGIPKTIDNDIDHIDRSFGFSSAVEAAQQAIRTAKTEARCNMPNGIGVVKLMGRSAGFIAVHAVMGSGDVDLCLVPEVPIVLEGEKGFLPFLMQRVKEKGHAVVVVAEGAGEELLGESAELDKSGNKKLPPIGDFIKKKIEEYYERKSKDGAATVKYIDPSYIIRSVPANAVDSLYCMQLAQNAVHGVMAGYTGFSAGLCNNRMVLLPIPELVETSPRTMDPHGRTWERVISLTRQPNTAPPKKKGEKSKYAPMLR